jgi:hypothetical protein
MPRKTFSFPRPALPAAASSGRFALWKGAVERKIGLEHIHRGLAEHAQPGADDVGVDHLQHGFRRGAPGLGDAGGLPSGVFRRDVRVKARGRGGDRVRRDGHAGRLLAQRLGVLDHALGEVGMERPEVGAARAGGVVAVIASGRGAGMQIFRLFELLGDEARADHLARAIPDQAAIGLVREELLADDGDQHRVAHAQQQGEEQGRDHGGANLSQHQTSPRLEMMRSTSLMPMNGATMPPRP